MRDNTDQKKLRIWTFHAANLQGMSLCAIHDTMVVTLLLPTG